MISLSILILFTVFSFLIAAWVLARSACAVGSPRGEFRFGLLAAFLAPFFAIILGVIATSAIHTVSASASIMTLALWIAQVVAVFFTLQFAFKLSSKRTFAPFGAYVALTLIQLALAIFIIKPFVVEAFVLPTQSMSPTLVPGDRFTVNKLLSPRRFDLVAYRSQDPRRGVYCKRLMGLPGERIRFENGGVFVNDQSLALPTVLAGRCHASPRAVPPSRARYRDGEIITLGNDEYFFIGDDVDLSWDSRLDGPSHASSLVGVADLLYWPLNKARLLR